MISNCEKQFVLQSIRNGKRLDGREFDEFRELELRFGSDYGCCYATLGETKVVAQVSCSLTEPRPMRPTEGCLFINVEISEAVCPSYDTGHQPHLATHANRLLEKCIKESNCLDLEALCLTAAEQVFDIRVDVTVLNYDGNLLTCCSVATLAALAHFKTPAVTVEDSEIIIHPIREKAPVPLSLHHFPILVSFAVFCDGEHTVVDPTEIEEKVSEGELVVGMNNYRELCGLHFSGRAIGNKDLILSCSSRAALIASDCVKRMKEVLEIDQKTRDKNRGESDGLTECIHLDRLLSASRDRQALRLQPEQVEKVLSRAKINQHMEIDVPEEETSEVEEEENEKMFTKIDKEGGVTISAMGASDFGKEWVPSGGKSTWESTGLSNEEESSDEDDVNYVKTITDEDRIIDKIELSGESEEEETVILK
ncbi:unnamed protein product [Nezara viridula]|uniref:Exosome complex component RRP45 n=1 Tax=Nezara viridula TaxID=85310 RepID=A0A9P0HJ45_NEZVI|nr:unnamed protein product [Nezara viridula]